MRHPDWQSRLDAYITANRNRPFSYDADEGLNCCTFTFAAIETMTGLDIGAPFAGKYRTPKEALMVMRDYCGTPSLSLFVAKLMADHGFARKASPMFANRGDAVLCPNGGGWFLGVLALNGRDVLSVGDGIRSVPISGKCRAWSI